MRDFTEFVLISTNAGNYGEGQALTATHAIPVFDADYNPEFNKQSINEARGFAGANVEQITDAHQMIKFKVLMRGSGAGQVDTPVPYAQALRLTGQSEQISVGTSVDYTLVSESFEHGDIYYYVGEVLHKLTGVRGSVSYQHDVGNLDYAEFTFLGLDEEVTEATAPNADWTGLETMLATNAATVSVLNLFGHDVSHTSLSIDPGQKFYYLNISNQEEIEYEGREGKITIRIKEPKPSEINFWEHVKKGTEGAFNFQRGRDGTDEGKIIVHSCPNVQLVDAKRSKDKGTLFLELTLNIVPLSKNTDITTQTR